MHKNGDQGQRQDGDLEEGGEGRKRTYFFGGGKAEGTKEMKNLLGGKGANLAEMANIGLPVPPGFTITTEVCTEFYAGGKKLPEGAGRRGSRRDRAHGEGRRREVRRPEEPAAGLVRSGARASMPGMMDTILNLGLNDKTAAGLAAKSGNERFAYDSYRRFVAMYGDVVLGLKPENKEDHDPFDEILARQEEGARREAGLRAAGRRAQGAGRGVQGGDQEPRSATTSPTIPYEQLEGAIKAVFQSWKNDRANLYRRLYNIPVEWGTAVNVQAMVFGNMGDDSATGVCFTRDPASGENVFYGEYLVNAQGEDVVAGIRTPEKIEALGKVLPKAYKQLLDIRKKLEKHYKDMQDIEFTIENGKLYMLQSRNGKRTGFAGVRIAVEMVDEKLIPKEEALRRVEPEALNQLLRPVFLPAAKKAAIEEGRLLAKGLPAGPGAATGKVVFFADEAEALAAKGETNLILVPPRDQPGGHPRHERVARLHDRVRRHDQPRGAGRAGRWARSASSAATRCRSTTTRGTMTVETAKGEVIVKEGDWISIDGFAGEVIDGRVDTTPREVIRVLIEKNLDAEGGAGLPAYAKLMSWADARAASCACAPTPTSPIRRRRRWRSAPRASASAAPSTCSSARGRSARCAR